MNTNEEDLGDGLTQDELFFWSLKKRDQNLVCMNLGHFERYGRCDSCKNCLCDKWWSGAFRCMCAYGKNMVSPSHLRWKNEQDRDHERLNHLYCIDHNLYEAKGAAC